MSDDDIDNYEVNYDRVAEDTQSHAIVRLLAINLKINPYLTVGEWLQSLSDGSLEDMIDIVNAEDSDESAMSNMILLVLMLTRAEQVFIRSDDDLARSIGMLRMFVCMASLQRKGMIKAFYENMSFGEDAMHLHVAEKI